MEKKKDYVGKLEQYPSNAETEYSIGSDSLVDIVKDNPLEEIKTVTIYITTKEIKTFDEAEEGFLNKFYGKPTEWDAEEMYGSEYTGWYGSNIEVEIDGHNLIDYIDEKWREDSRYVAIRFVYGEEV